MALAATHEHAASGARQELIRGSEQPREGWGSLPGDAQKSRLVWRAGRQDPEGGSESAKFLKLSPSWTIEHLPSLCLFVQNSDPVLLSLTGSCSCLLATGRQGAATLLSSGGKSSFQK